MKNIHNYKRKIKRKTIKSKSDFHIRTEIPRTSAVKLSSITSDFLE